LILWFSPLFAFLSSISKRSRERLALYHQFISPLCIVVEL